ncbi:MULTISPECIES: hypothetical protein [Pseudomonas]|uniref:Uncharacterized protein n=1 Tax=Pseudomonas monachiensis TaxID=3060212 RepID=A0ABW9H3L8_9PSED|nr:MULTISPECIES: hypothetical protein [unclassified Pseudomonas]KRA85826.1 hypothetical protein ASD91_20700 [Pseudomonas sp. Root68]KRB71500.1 hypothetical protein ASD95_21765 [Pseudomonas sp. Root71]
MGQLTRELVRAKLHARLGGRGIDVDKVYINAIASANDSTVIYSQSLVWAFFLKLQDSEVPRFSSENLGIFSEPYTFDRKYRFDGVKLDELNEMGAAIARDLLS